MKNFSKELNINAKNTEKFLKNFFSKQKLYSDLTKPMKYGLFSGGKRFRSSIVVNTGKIFDIDYKKLIIISAAIECIHSYSLIHDDLPSMDDDDFRRGKFSTHKKFNEATAILAGDALHDLAFEILSNPLTHKSASVRIKLVNNLAKLIGHQGLAGGQSLDLIYENNNKKKNNVINMYKLKTGSLFQFCFSTPFMLTNHKKEIIEFYRKFGLLFGLVFQVIDDLIDENISFKTIGKTPGKDKKQGKSTLLSVIGKEETILFCHKEINKFTKKNKSQFKKNPILKELLFYNLSRIK